MRCMCTRIYTAFWHSMKAALRHKQAVIRQANLDPGVMLVHLGAGACPMLGTAHQCLGGESPRRGYHLCGGTPAATCRSNRTRSQPRLWTDLYRCTFYEAKLDRDANPKDLHKPFIAPYWLPKTPPVGPVHLAVYDRVLGPEEINTNIIEGGTPRPPRRLSVR